MDEPAHSQRRRSVRKGEYSEKHRRTVTLVVPRFTERPNVSVGHDAVLYELYRASVAQRDEDDILPKLVPTAPGSQ